VVVVGAGMGGLAAAIDLARSGLAVTVVEKAAAPGGKMREIKAGAATIDAGPTVFTMRWVFDGLLEDAGVNLNDRLVLQAADVLARHAWDDGSRLDLHADVERSTAAIARFASAADAAGFRRFCARCREIHDVLVGPFMTDQRPGMVELLRRVGIGGIPGLLRTAPFKTLWRALDDYFEDPRLRQLFGRYATYCGSSPLQAPATLLLVAHVELEGVWRVEGGMHRVARVLHEVGMEQGADFRFASAVERIEVEKGRAAGVVLADGERLAADAVVFNGDVSALGDGLLGKAVERAAPSTPRQRRSLSAITWCLNTTTRGFPLSHHNVFFGDDYPDEFEAIFTRRAITDQPTVYVCAQDRADEAHMDGPERLLVLVNAPPDGDRVLEPELDEITGRAFERVRECGLEIDRPEAGTVTTPGDWDGLFPGTGGALYGPANHGPLDSFRRQGARSRVPGLYFAGGSVHPGPGIPMATLSGRLAARMLLEDLGD